MTIIDNHHRVALRERQEPPARAAREPREIIHGTFSIMRVQKAGRGHTAETDKYLKSLGNIAIFNFKNATLFKFIWKY